MIPSWYPTKEHPGVGGFFQQQAELFQERYDIKVMYGYCPYLEHKTLYGRYHRYMMKNRENEKDLEMQDRIPTIRFTYGNWWMGEKSLIKASINSYRHELKRLIKNGWKPDILQAQCMELGGIVVATLSKEFNIPWTLTEHQRFGLGNYSTYRQALMRTAINSAPIIAVVSQHLLRCIAIHNIDKPMVVVGNLIDDEIFQSVLSKKEQNPFRILTIMWPNMIKDPETFFHAIAVMVEKGQKNIEAVVIGKKLLSKADTSDFQRLVEKYKLHEVCQLIAEVPLNEMPKYYAESDVLVSTSVEETFGITVREAMAMGRPVVCTASGGVDDDIFEFNGFKVDIHDFNALADSLIAIKTGSVQFDPVRIREYVISKYGRQAFLEKMSKVFDYTLGIR